MTRRCQICGHYLYAGEQRCVFCRYPDHDHHDDHDHVHAALMEAIREWHVHDDHDDHDDHDNHDDHDDHATEDATDAAADAAVADAAAPPPRLSSAPPLSAPAASRPSRPDAAAAAASVAAPSSASGSGGSSHQEGWELPPLPEALAGAWRDNLGVRWLVSEVRPRVNNRGGEVCARRGGDPGGGGGAPVCVGGAGVCVVRLWRDRWWVGSFYLDALERGRRGGPAERVVWRSAPGRRGARARVYSPLLGLVGPSNTPKHTFCCFLTFWVSFST